MSKIIESPVKAFPGHVTISDPLTFPQVFAVEDALAEADRLKSADPPPSMSRLNYALLPAILACVEHVEIKGLPERLNLVNFPATPRSSSAALSAWLLKEVISLFNEAQEVPFG